MATNTGPSMQVSARDIVERKFNPAAYPYHHLAIVQVAKIGTPDSQIPLVMSAVELLGQVGWELAGFAIAHRTVVAVMRRRQP